MTRYINIPTLIKIGKRQLKSQEIPNKQDLLRWIPFVSTAQNKLSPGVFNPVGRIALWENQLEIIDYV